MKPTKINLFVVDGYQPYDVDFLYSFAMKKIFEISRDCGYTFEVPMPVTIEAVRVERNKRTVNKLFGGTKEVSDVSYCYNLVFDKELTDVEVNMWRMFKMGRRSARWPRY